MRLRENFFLQEKHENNIKREYVDEFRSTNISPQCKYKKALSREFLGIIPKIKFRSVRYTFQEKLTEDIPKAKSPQTFSS